MTQVEETYAHVRIFRNRAEIETLRDFWNSCKPTRDADLDFYLFLVELFPQSLRPHVVVVYDKGFPQSILAGRLELRRLPVKAGYFSIPTPKIKILEFVHGGWLGDRSDRNSKFLINSIMGSLSEREADAVVVQSVDPDSPLAKYARDLPRAWCSDYLINPEIHRFRELTGMRGNFLASLSKNERSKQKKRARELDKNFSTRKIRVFETVEEIDQLMHDVEDIARKSYQRGLGVGFSDSQITKARLKYEARVGWLRGYVLYLDERPCAFWIGSLRNRVFVSNFLAFDPAFSQFAPGMYLLLETIGRLASEPHGSADCVDFGGGEAPYKERLGNVDRHESHIWIFAPRAVGIGLNLLRSTVGVTTFSVKRVLRASGMFGSLKRFIRARGTRP
jgi:hypothetical protein